MFGRQILGVSLGLVGSVALTLVCGEAFAQNLVVQWTFDEAAGGTTDALDTGAAPATTGVLGSTATRTNDTPGGKPGFALDLSDPAAAGANTSVVDGGNPLEVDTLAQFTFSMWLKITGESDYNDGGSGNVRLLAKQSGGLFDGFSWNMNAGVQAATGDYNENNTVDPADYTVWRDLLGQDVTLPNEDPGTTPGTVTPEDYDVWASNFGNRGGSRANNDFRMSMFIGGETAFAFDFSPDILGRGGDWLFLATTYDGNSTVDNFKYFIGDETTAVSQFGDTLTIDAGPVFSTNLTNPNAVADARFMIGNTDAAPTVDFSVDGYQDDVRVYDGVLDLAALEAVRLENLPAMNGGSGAPGSAGVPEPTTLALTLMGLALAGWARGRGVRRPLR